MKMKSGWMWALLGLLCLGGAKGADADPVITNLSVAQRPGTKLVDISYDVSSEGAEWVNVSLAVENDGSPVAATSLAGDVGLEVAVGVGKAIVWDAGADWAGNVATLAYAVIAYDGIGTPLGGDPTATSWEEVNERWVRNFYADGATTMSDRDTGLMWVYDASANGTATWDYAIAHCNNLVYAGHSDWFLPDRWQLYAMYSQKAVFTGVQAAWYWSSTPYFDYGAWVVGMGSGSVINGGRSNDNWVWPCRSGQ